MTPPHPANTTSTPAEVYADRLAGRRDELNSLRRRYSFLSGQRRLLVGVVIVLIVLVEKEGLLTKLLLNATPALLLFYLIKRRVRIARSIWETQWLAGFYERRLACVEGSWAGTGETGTRFVLPDHPSAADLDLFGTGSLFERLSTPCTCSGADTLAGWLLAPAGANEVRDRQAAVIELRGLLDLREQLAYLAAQVSKSHEVHHIARWGQSTPERTSLGIEFLGALTLTATLAALLGGVFFGTGPVPVLICLGVQVGYSRVFCRSANKTLDPLEERTFDLASLGRLFARLEQASFTSPRLKQLHSELTVASASRELARLARLCRWAAVAQILACRPQVAWLLDRWRRESGRALGRWLAALGEIEALCALAAYSFECPDDPFPDVVETSTIFEAESLGHPLIDPARCVGNDLTLGGDRMRLLIVSGSNMAGKSTLLRAVGVNTVLGLAGAPVRARRLRLSPFVVGATLRIQDSLSAGRSHFHAEVLRVRQLLEMSRGPVPLLFLLDELFQGTNSADRRGGAGAVLRQLVEAGALGLVTTHDLALTDIADRLEGRAGNVHFDDRYDDGEMTFDYRMKPGVVQHTNGLALMRAVGIEV